MVIIFFFNIYWSIVGFQQSGVQQSESVIHLHISTLFFFHIGIAEYWLEFPVLYGKSFLVIYFIYSHLYMSIPIFPPPSSIPFW